MNIFHRLAGSVRVEVTSADLPGTLQRINSMKIPLFDLRFTGDLTVEFTILYRNLKRLQSDLKDKGNRIVILSHGGIFWFVWRFKQRPILMITIVILFMLTLLLPGHILFVEVEGNETVPERLILETASSAGIRFGATRRDVRSEKMKNQLLGMLPQLQWAGVNTNGCTATISVRERTQQTQEYVVYPVSRVVAACDGVITSCVITNGSGLCTVGQAVQKGQLLISGYTDCGGVITAGPAKGEIFAQTRHEVTAVSPSKTANRTCSSGVTTKYSLCFGKKRINFYKGSGISDARCAKMVTQYHLTLPGGRTLPLTLIKEQCTAYQLHDQQIEATQLHDQMSDYLQKLLRSDRVALSIVDAHESVASTDDAVCLKAIYNCIEMIGRELAEQIGESHGETD